MELKEIQDLIRFVSKAGVSEVEIEKDGFKIVIKAEMQHMALQPTYVTAAPQAMQQPMQMASNAPVQNNAQAAVEADLSASSGEANYITIKSPMIGTFYRSGGPDKEPFVKVGDSIDKGDVICIVEAMKLFNEIESDISGKIVKILVDNSSPVEYDQPLYLVDPS